MLRVEKQGKYVLPSITAGIDSLSAMVAAWMIGNTARLPGLSCAASEATSPTAIDR
jgi:hypothetical protein